MAPNAAVDFKLNVLNPGGRGPEQADDAVLVQLLRRNEPAMNST